MTRPTNAHRGEVTLELEGQAFGLRPSYEAILAIEEQTGASIIELARAADAMALPLAKASLVVTELVRAWGREVDDTGAKGANPKRIGEMLMSHGLPSALTAVTAVLMLAATGGYTPAGELKAETKTTTGPSSAASPRSPRGSSAGRRKRSG